MSAFSTIARASLLAAVLAGGPLSCTPADRAGLPVISQIDSVMGPLAKVVGWCHESGAKAERISPIVSKFKGGDKAGATLDALILVDEMRREHGIEVPPEVQKAIELAAVQGLQDGMRALSGGGS